MKAPSWGNAGGLKKEVRKMLKKEEITVVCAWCGKLLRQGTPPMKHISHAICQECYNIEIKKIETGGVHTRR